MAKLVCGAAVILIKLSRLQNTVPESAGPLRNLLRTPLRCATARRISAVAELCGRCVLARRHVPPIAV